MADIFDTIFFECCSKSYPPAMHVPFIDMMWDYFADRYIYFTDRYIYFEILSMQTCPNKIVEPLIVYVVFIFIGH